MVIEPKTKAEYDKHLADAKGPVIVDFVQHDCSVCDPASLDALAKDCSEVSKATIMRVEISEGFGSELANEFKVEGTPTTMMAESVDKFTPTEAVEVDPGSKAVRRKLKCAR